MIFGTTLPPIQQPCEIVEIIVIGDSLSSDPLAYYPIDDAEACISVRKGWATHPGWNTEHSIDPAFAPAECGGLSPVECEFAIGGDIAFMQIGTNNSDESILSGAYESHIRQIVELSNVYGITVVLVRPPINYFRQGVLSEMHAALDRVGHDYGLLVIGPWFGWEQLQDDAVHVTPDGYQIFNEQILEVVQ